MLAERFTQSKELIKKSAQTVVSLQQKAIVEFEKKYFFPKEAQKLKSNLNNPNSVLDVGSGAGYFGKALKNEMPEALVVCTDVESKHAGNIPFVTANSAALPFLDKSFDVVTAFYMLHHTSDPKKVLQEAKRVSRDNVVVQEDSYKNRFEQFMYNFHLRSYQFGSPFSHISSVRTDKEWEDLFKETGFEIVQKRRIRKIGYPITRHEYVLASTPKEK